ncbi:SpoVA/SpoVAEb family sporulation membrane protein [Peribacillus frigoritolerans]|nr:SpoVA/SpoVAEb family sporulation membrane protein [Peribacillus frigoritolerans]
MGQAISYFYIYFFQLYGADSRKSDNGHHGVSGPFDDRFSGFTTALASLGGQGSAVPVTGFGNAVISAAIEHRTEGFVLGVGSNMFKLAGSVILFGVFSAFVVALIKTIYLMIGG